MKILALDASTTAVGWCEANDDEYVNSGVFLPSKGEWQERIQDIGRWMHNLQFRWHYDVLFYEIATGSHRNMATDRKLGALEYACWCQARRFSVGVVPVTASQVRATGVHKKALAAAIAVAGGELDTRRPGDEADALGVWLAGLKVLKVEALRMHK